VTMVLTSLLVLLTWRTALLLSGLDQQRNRIDDELKRAKLAAETANRAKSALVANISHELRTPLTAITGFADLYFVGGAAAGHDRDDYVRTIRRNGQHLLTVINDLLDLSKLEAGRMQVEIL